MKYIKKKKSKEKKDIVLDNANLCFRFSNNNLIITLAKTNGDVVAFSSPAVVGFKNNKKSTLFAMKATTLNIIEKCNKFKVNKVDVFVNGFSRNINDILKLLISKIEVNSLRETTSLAFNGTRLRNRRRT